MTRRQILAQLGALGLVAACAEVDPASYKNNAIFEIPSITPNEQHYVTSCCPTPTVDPDTWTLQILDRGVPVASLDYAFLLALEAREREHTLECIGAGPRNQKMSNAIWSGLPLREVLDLLGVDVDPAVTGMKWVSADEYSTHLPIEDLDDGPLWLVWLMNGEPLPARNGFPARLLVPGRYGMKNPKWILSLELVDAWYEGYWESRGWSDSAEYKPNTLVRFPRPDEVVNAGTIRFAGTAYAGRDPVVAVDVRYDGGPWEPAVLDYAPGLPDIWCVWHLDGFVTPGEHVVEARCTTASGAQSIDEDILVRDLTGYGGSMRSTFQVEG